MNNFLSIVWYKVLPPHYGGQKGIAHFNEQLGKKVKLTCLCSRNNIIEGPHSYKLINDLPVSKFQFWNPMTRRKIHSFIRRNNFTHLIIEHPWHGWLGKYKKKYGFKLIVHAHNIEYLRMKSKNTLSWRWLKKIESHAFKLADLIIFKTEGDEQIAINSFNISQAKCLIVPYGTSEHEPPVIDPLMRELSRKNLNVACDEKMILFAGTPDYPPNSKAVETIVNEIIPRLRKEGLPFRMVICGGINNDQKKMLSSITEVTLAGFVSSMLEYYQAADVFINPVIGGSGIQTKNIEAIANGCTVVSTAFAANGMPEYIRGKKLFISPDHDWQSFNNNIIQAHTQQEKTPAQFYHDYNWHNIVDRMLSQIG